MMATRDRGEALGEARVRMTAATAGSTQSKIVSDRSISLRSWNVNLALKCMM